MTPTGRGGWGAETRVHFESKVARHREVLMAWLKTGRNRLGGVGVDTQSLGTEGLVAWEVKASPPSKEALSWVRNKNKDI